MSPIDAAHRARYEVERRFAPYIHEGKCHFVMHPHTWAEVLKDGRGTERYRLWGLEVALDTSYAVGDVSCEFRYSAVVR